MKKLLPAIAFTICLTTATPAIALSNAIPDKQPTPTVIYSPKRADSLVFRGIVQKLASGEGTALYTEKAVYPLLGGNFQMIVGEEVNVIGKVIREGNVEKIMVARVQFDRQ